MYFKCLGSSGGGGRHCKTRFQGDKRSLDEAGKNRSQLNEAQVG